MKSPRSRGCDILSGDTIALSLDSLSHIPSQDDNIPPQEHHDRVIHGATVGLVNGSNSENDGISMPPTCTKLLRWASARLWDNLAIVSFLFLMTLFPDIRMGTGAGAQPYHVDVLMSVPTPWVPG
jgi:hypothetical protein